MDTTQKSPIHVWALMKGNDNQVQQTYIGVNTYINLLLLTGKGYLYNRAIIIK